MAFRDHCSGIDMSRPWWDQLSVEVIENARNASAVVISRIKSLGPSFSRSSSDSVIDVSPNLNVDAARKAGETIPFSFGFGF